jgi:hypothetical protein
VIRGNSGRRGRLARYGLLIHNSGVPPTLGTCLIQAMVRHGHTNEDAADALGRSPSEIDLWASDRQVPGTADLDLLVDYLEVDLDALRGLILRSQMLRAQRLIHGIPASA